VAVDAVTVKASALRYAMLLVASLAPLHEEGVPETVRPTMVPTGILMLVEEVSTQALLPPRAVLHTIFALGPARLAVAGLAGTM